MSKKEELITIKKMLAKVLFNFAEYKTTDEKILIVDDKVEVGVDAYTYDENGEKVIATDGDYMIEEVGLVVVKDGKVSEIKPKEEEQTEEQEVEQKVEQEMSKVESVEDKNKEELEKFKSELQVISEKYDKLINVVDGMFKTFEKFAEQPIKEEEKKQIEVKVDEKPTSKASKYFTK
jgi:hypothetical protein